MPITENDIKNQLDEQIKTRLDRVLESITSSEISLVAWPILEARREEISALVNVRLTVILAALEKEIDNKLLDGLREFYEVDRAHTEELGRVIGRRIHEAFGAVAEKLKKG